MDRVKRDPYGIYKTLTRGYLLILVLPRGSKRKLYYIMGINKRDGCRWTN